MIKKSEVKNLLKKAVVGVSVVGVLVSTNAMASTKVSAAFSKVKVDSNEYTTIAKITKQIKYEYAYVTISDIYKADGSASNYQQIQAKVVYNDNGTWKICEEKAVKKGEKADFHLLINAQRAGVTLRFRAMGNNPSLDCKVTGYFESY